MGLSWFSKKKDAAAAPSEPPAASAPPAPSPTSPSVGRLLTEELVVFAPPGLDKDGLIEFLVRRLCEKKSLGAADPFLAKVLEREQGISTTLDTGLAIPHARMDEIEDLAAILGLIPRGMSDLKHAEFPIRAMFLFFSPNRQEAFTAHLHLLRGAAALFQSAFIEELLRQRAAAEILHRIRSKEGA